VFPPIRAFGKKLNAKSHQTESERKKQKAPKTPKE
jgi:hypothetical protein